METHIDLWFAASIVAISLLLSAAMGLLLALQSGFGLLAFGLIGAFASGRRDASGNRKQYLKEKLRAKHTR